MYPSAPTLTKSTPLVAGLNPNLLHVRDRHSQQRASGEHQHIASNMHGPRVGQRPWLRATKSRLGSRSLLSALSYRRCIVLEGKDRWFWCVAAGMVVDI